MASLPIIVKYLLIFLISMVPIVELRGAIPMAEGLGLNIFLYYPIAIIGNIVWSVIGLLLSVLTIFLVALLFGGSTNNYRRKSNNSTTFNIFGK